MIFRIKGIDLDVIIEEGDRVVLEILDKNLFRSTIYNLRNTINGEENNEVVLENAGNIVNYAKGVDLVLDYFDFDINSKSVLQILYKQIENNILQDTEMAYKIEALLLELCNLISLNTEDFEFPLEHKSEASISNILKLFDYRINYLIYSGVLDKLFLYIDIITVFNLKSVLVFINLKSYFNEKEIIEIYKYLNYKKLLFLCIESMESAIIKSETKYQIDDDLVEFGPFK